MAIDPIAMLTAGSKVIGAVAGGPKQSKATANQDSDITNIWQSPFVVGDGNSTPVNTPTAAGSVPAIAASLAPIILPLVAVGGLIWLAKR